MKTTYHSVTNYNPSETGIHSHTWILTREELKRVQWGGSDNSINSQGVSSHDQILMNQNPKDKLFILTVTWDTTI